MVLDAKYLFFFFLEPTGTLTHSLHIIVQPLTCLMYFTFLRAAAGLWAARAADITATSLRATLAAANTKEDDEEEGPNDHEDHRQPI